MGPAVMADLVAEIWRNNPSIKDIDMTGYAEDAFRSLNEGNALMNLLQKPFGKVSLANMVRSVLGR